MASPVGGRGAGEAKVELPSSGASGRGPPDATEVGGGEGGLWLWVRYRREIIVGHLTSVIASSATRRHEMNLLPLVNRTGGERWVHLGWAWQGG
jgi:hypothetical protein